MIEVKLTGGLGNQMFQYAYAKSLQSKGYDVVLDSSIYVSYILHGGCQLDEYDISLSVIDKKENRFLQKLKNKLGIKPLNLWEEELLSFDKKHLHPNNGIVINGYFQSEKYFSKIREVLLHDFSIKRELSFYAKEIEEKIKNSKNSCSIHIRRGDYISNQETQKVHGSCDLEYYSIAMEVIESENQVVNYFIFSDDIVWVKDNLKIVNAIFVDNNEKRIPHEDIYLMSLCQNNIIANSSFSWWGAWLNSYHKKLVVAPKRWFADEKLFLQSQDIVCESWIQV